MNYARAQHVPSSAIPVIDLGSLHSGDMAAFRIVAEEIQRAASSVGFFYVKNHGVDQALIDSVFAVSKTFFELDEDEKQKVSVNTRHRGFLKVGEATMEGSSTIDLKESYIWGREYTATQLDALNENPLIGANQWPAPVPEMKPLFNEYFEACVSLGRLILRVFAVGLNVDPGYFSEKFDATITRASTLFYPPQPSVMGEEQFGVAPHTDYGALTLLYQDGTGGLQVCGKDGWVTAHPIPGAYVVNVGDLLHRWTNGLFTSTPHRVVNSSEGNRQSIAVFVDPDFDTEIVPVVEKNGTSRFEPITCGEHIQQRFDSSFDYRK